MLVLSRKVGQSFKIGDSITVTILRVTGNSVRIGIEAPRTVLIRRNELDSIPQPQGDRMEIEVELPPETGDAAA